MCFELHRLLSISTVGGGATKRKHIFFLLAILFTFTDFIEFGEKYLCAERIHIRGISTLGQCIYRGQTIGSCPGNKGIIQIENYLWFWSANTKRNVVTEGKKH